MQEDPMTAICSLTYWGIKNAAMRKGKDSKLMGFDQFCALVLDDGETFESLSASRHVYPESRGRGKRITGSGKAPVPPRRGNPLFFRPVNRPAP